MGGEKSPLPFYIIKMEAEEKLKRARIQIQGKNSFFAYLSLYLKFKESRDLPDYAGAGVNARGDFFYRKEFVEGLSGKEVEGVIVHEILHLSLLHLLRIGGRDSQIWNISADIVVNQLLKDNNFAVGKGWIVSDNSNAVDVGAIKVEDCDKKTSEQIYSELEKQAKELMKELGSDGSGDGMRFDEHLEGKDEANAKKGKKGKGKLLSPSELKELEKMWSDRTQEALIISKMRGDTPTGIGRLVGELHKEKINWKALLNQYITQQIPYNHSYAHPHKKSRSTGFYMPHMTKEKIDIVIGIDVSGSIGQKELTDFLSEICGIARTYQERINMRLITHECDVVDDYEVRNGSIAEIMKLEIHGGGGTSHSPLFDYIKENVSDCKCALFLTDGYSDIDQIEFEKYSFGKLFVISEGGSDDQLNDKRCNKINLGEY